MSTGSNSVTHLSDCIDFAHTFMRYVAYRITQASIALIRFSSCSSSTPSDCVCYFELVFPGHYYKERISSSSLLSPRVPFSNALVFTSIIVPKQDSYCQLSAIVSNFFPIKVTHQTKLGSLSIPNVDLSEKSDKVVINEDEYQHFFTSKSL